MRIIYCYLQINSCFQREGNGTYTRRENERNYSRSPESIIGSAPVLVTLAHLYKTRLINTDTHLISLDVKIIISSSLPRIRGTHSSEKGHITHLPPLCEIAVSSHVESKVPGA